VIQLPHHLGIQNVRDEERSVGQKKLRRKPYRRKRWRSYLGFRGMTLRNWLPIVIAAFIPILIAFGTWRITTEQGKLENQRAEAERELADQRALDEALQAYLDQMNNLLLAHNLRDSGPGNEVRTLARARARTLTVLSTLSPSRKTAVINFLAEADLISILGTTASFDAVPIAELTGADLSGTDMSNMYLVHTNLLEADLREANLNGTNMIKANLSKANLTNATLRNTELGHASLLFTDLRDANLRDANIGHANLSAANLSNADLRNTGLRSTYWPDADLSNADLREANLTGADLSNAHLSTPGLRYTHRADANLSNADLSEADLTDAHVSEQQLRSAASLERATMPDGQTLRGGETPHGPTFEEWLKSKGGGEDGENSSSS
jgi:uncharacterized protein YjbI with pentapeptide repeats